MIDLWVADVETMASIPRAELAWLAKDERAKLERFRLRMDRRRYLVSRVLLRKALSQATGLAPAELRFHTREEGGKPRLVTSEVDFNLSHSGNAVVVAVSRTYEVGVDIEHLSGDSEPLRLWTLKEAYVKMLGTGLDRDPEEIELPSVESGVRLEYRLLQIGARAYGLAIASR